MDVTHGMVWTVGHSNRPLRVFLGLLKAHGIEVVVDVRSAPSSVKFPHFNQDALRGSLGSCEIGYVHVPELGGHRPRQRAVHGNPNGGWTSSSFRNYADWALGWEFRQGLAELQEIASGHRTAFMCAEADPAWNCHRVIISDHMTAAGWRVRHILTVDRAPLHIPGKCGVRPSVHDGTVTYPPAYLQPALPFGKVA